MTDMKWQTIDSAPRDGTEFLGWTVRVLFCRWDDDRYAKNPRPYFTTHVEHIMGKIYTRASQPTHWAPIPDGPLTGDESI